MRRICQLLLFTVILKDLLCKWCEIYAYFELSPFSDAVVTEPVSTTTTPGENLCTHFKVIIIVLIFELVLEHFENQEELVDWPYMQNIFNTHYIHM